MGILRYAWKCAGMVPDWKANYLTVLRPILRVRHRLVSGRTGWFLVRRRGEPAFGWAQTTPRWPLRPRRLPCCFPIHASGYGESKLKLFGGAVITRERAKPAEPGVEAHDHGRKYHRSDRGHGNGGYEQHGNLFTQLLRTGRRSNTATATRTVR